MNFELTPGECTGFVAGQEEEEVTTKRLRGISDTKDKKLGVGRYGNGVRDSCTSAPLCHCLKEKNEKKTKKMKKKEEEREIMKHRESAKTVASFTRASP